MTLVFDLRAVYQIFLSSGLNVYLFSPMRGPGLLSLNKEGIASTFGGCLHLSSSLNSCKLTSLCLNNSEYCGDTVAGYWGLYLISVHLGYFLTSKQTSVVHPTSPPSNNKKEKKTVALRSGQVVGMWILDIILW
jgi:hypothetical protein